MTSLLQALVEKAAFDNGWEIVENGRVFRSGRHSGTLVATDLGRALQLEFVGTPDNLLEVSFPALAVIDGSLILPYVPDRFTAALPALEAVFRTTADGASAEPPSIATERLATVKQRVGQADYREDLFSLWGGACAVTGLAEPALLRASHMPSPGATPPTPNASIPTTAFRSAFPSTPSSTPAGLPSTTPASSSFPPLSIRRPYQSSPFHLPCDSAARQLPAIFPTWPGTVRRFSVTE